MARSATAEAAALLPAPADPARAHRRFADQEAATERVVMDYSRQIKRDQRDETIDPFAPGR
jgi:hypothetical protein